MTPQEVTEQMIIWDSKVMGQKIDKDVSHIIGGFGVKEKSPGEFDLYVIGQDLSNHTPWVKNH